MARLLFLSIVGAGAMVLASTAHPNQEIRVVKYMNDTVDVFDENGYWVEERDTKTLPAEATVRLDERNDLYIMVVDGKPIRIATTDVETTDAAKSIIKCKELKIADRVDSKVAGTMGYDPKCQ